MVLSKYKLPNENVFIWLGKGGIWGESEGLDNVLILAGGDILFLKTIKCLSLSDHKLRDDMKNLSYEEFIKQYELPANGDLWKELNEGVKSGEYPPFLQNTKGWIKDIQNMMAAYIGNILKLKDPDEKIRQLEAIMEYCRRSLLKIKTEKEE